MPWWMHFLGKRPGDGQLDEELRYHLERLTEDKVAAGMEPDEARREAAIEFGGREQFKEELRDVHRIVTLENTFANLRSGIRLMRKSPSFSAAVILTLALGIGANSTVFSAIDAILLRPLPFPAAGELVLIHQYNREAKSPNTSVAPVRLEEWNQRNQTLQAISGWGAQNASETSGELPEEISEAFVAPRFLRVWGVSPQVGRGFTTQEEHFGAGRVALISDRFWRRRFHGDPEAIGKTLRLEQRSYTIVGVMPASFSFPDREVDVWCPSAPDDPWAQDRSETWYTTIGRLKKGVTVAQAQMDLATLQSQLGREFPKSDAKLGVGVEALKESTVGGIRRSLWILFGVVSLLLLITCTNVAALLLARTTEREREISVRLSLGASKLSIVAQLLTECFVLAAAGSGLSLLVAEAGSRGLRVLAGNLPRVEEITLDWRMVLYTLACGVVCTLLFGTFPAIRGIGRGIRGDLARASRTQVSMRNPAQWILVGVQVALAVTLLMGAGLLLRSFEELGRVAPGFETSHILTLRLSGSWAETANLKALSARIHRTLREVENIPGVRSAASSAFLPGMPGDNETEIRIAEERGETKDKVVADTRFVSHGYFATMKIPLLAGESCRESIRTDSAVVNRSFADKYFGGSRAIGHDLEVTSNTFIPPVQIRGIVADAREQGLNREPTPTAYWCLSAADPSPWILVRTQGEPMSMAEVLRRKLHEIEPARSAFDMMPLEQHLSDSFGENRLRTILLTLFAALAISLAWVGLYGTLSYFVAVRRREIGLRLALGALRGQIVGQLLTKGLVVGLAGCAAGLCLGAALCRLMSGLLYGVSLFDPVTWIGVVGLIAGVALVGSSLPAFRAARLDPIEVLREE